MTAFLKFIPKVLTYPWTDRICVMCVTVVAVLVTNDPLTKGILGALGGITVVCFTFRASSWRYLGDQVAKKIEEKIEKNDESKSSGPGSG